MIYFDWAATALPDSGILDTVRGAEKEYFGNPSSIHQLGRKAKKFFAQSREMLARVLGVDTTEIIFTSGGTESNNMILFSLLARFSWKSSVKRKIVAGGIEHPSVYEPLLVLKNMGYEVVFINPNNNGYIEPEKIESSIDSQTVLVTCMHVNNETSAIQPIKQIGEIVREKEKKTGQKILFHVDAVQAFGKIPFHPYSLNIDTASVSAHKLGGSKGCGALFIKKNTPARFLFKGGEQEEKRRPGTENTAGSYSLALAAEKAVSALDKHYRKTSALMKKLITGLVPIKGIVFIPESRREPGEGSFSPYILKIAFPGIPGEVLVRMLEEKEIFVSTGAACSSQKKKGKHRVLQHMGIPMRVADSSIRISLGTKTTEEEVDFLISTLATLIPDLQKLL